MRWLGALVGLLCAIPVALSAAPETPGSELRITGLTFVGSRGSLRQVVLHSRRAVFHPRDDQAQLEDVRATVSEDDRGRNFSIRCDRAQLDIESNDFLAEGDVRGETADGQHYTTEWVRYEHEPGILSTDAPVRMEDESGSFSGDGFRYHVHERRFQLLGNVRVEQTR